MNSRHRTSSCGAGFSRRDLLRGSAAAIGASLIAPGAQAAGIGIPGPYRGRVVSVAHSAAISGGVVQASAVRQMFQMGMLRLTGASTVPAAWSQLINPTDVVGIKINSASGPNTLSSPQVYAELVAEIASVGVPLSNIVIFDKFRPSFANLNMWSWVPPGVGLMFADQAADWTWQSTEGMDLQCFVDLPYTMAGQSLDDPFNRRSYIALFATQVVTKIVNLAVMKDHNYAGVTLSLKNMSYGMASNVERGHDDPNNPHFDVLIPNIVAAAPIRSKVVLNIVDSIQAVYSGGPGFTDRHDVEQQDAVLRYRSRGARPCLLEGHRCQACRFRLPSGRHARPG